MQRREWLLALFSALVVARAAYCRFLRADLQASAVLRVLRHEDLGLVGRVAPDLALPVDLRLNRNALRVVVALRLAVRRGHVNVVAPLIRGAVFEERLWPPSLGPSFTTRLAESCLGRYFVLMCPPTEKLSERPVFQIDDTYQVPGVGAVISSAMVVGRINIATQRCL